MKGTLIFLIGYSFSVVLTLVLTVLKVLGVIVWPWIWVFAFVWIPILLSIGAVAFFVLIVSIQFMHFIVSHRR